MGREWRIWNPYYRTGTSYNGSFAANATAHDNAYPNLSSTTPYRELVYTPDPLSRVKTETARASHLGYVGAPQARGVSMEGCQAALAPDLINGYRDWAD